MASLTSASWKVQFLHATGYAQSSNARGVDTSVGTRHKFVQAIMVLASTAGGESPKTGVPWPDKGNFGFYRSIDNIVIHNVHPRSGATVGAITASGEHIIAVTNATGGTIRFYNESTATGTAQRALKQLATTITVTAGHRFYVTAIGW